MEGYKSVAKTLRQTLSPKLSWFGLALVRYKLWQGYGENPAGFPRLPESPLLAGPGVHLVLVKSGGMIVTKRCRLPVLLRRASCASRRRRAADESRERSVHTECSIAVCIPAKRAAGAFDTGGAPCVEIPHS
jgi:hypothetical protein